MRERRAEWRPRREPRDRAGGAGRGDRARLADRAEREHRLGGHIGRGLLWSLVLHAGAVVPLVATGIWLGKRPPGPAPEDVEVTFENVRGAELPADLPPLEDERSPRRRVPRLAEKRPADEALPEEPPPVQVEKLEEPPEEVKPTPPPPDKLNQKMVDLDMGKDVEPPPDARYLAQKNNRADEQTQARDTNLERAQTGGVSSAPSDRQDERPGAERDRIAELDDRRSKLGRRAPDVTPHENPALGAAAARAESLLSMRQAPRRQHTVTPETADPSLPRDPDGMRPLVDDRPASLRELAGQRGAAARPRLSLTARQFDYLFGADALAAERLAHKERSQRKGRFAERQERIQAALENFIPEVKPGNQTALNTRAHPFAAFITRMHRSIHRLWAFGFLDDLDRKPLGNAYSKQDLLTKLEIVLDGAGVVSKVTVVRSSGYLPFDVAAIDTVHSGGPFPDPPREIRSGNGKIYVHWTFHRDERACGTPGVDYFILDNAGSAADRGDATPGPVVPERVSREVPAGASPRASSAGPRGEGPRRLGRDDGAEGGSARSPAGARFALERPRSDSGGGRRYSDEEPDPASARRAAAELPSPGDAAARSMAETWFGAYARGDVATLLKLASFPFRAGGSVVARTATDLGPMLKAVITESPSRRLRGLEIVSPARARGLLGGLPPGLGDDPALLLAIARLDADMFVLAMSKRSGAWRAVGLARR